MQAGTIVERERKFIIEKEVKGDWDSIMQYIEQTYLVSKDNVDERVRMIIQDDKVYYEHTIKTDAVSTKHMLIRNESEERIEEEEYLKLIKERGYSKIIKNRELFKNVEGKDISIDYFISPENLVMMEIEYDGVDEEILIPNGIKIIKEVTEDEQYRNKNMAILMV